MHAYLTEDAVIGTLLTDSYLLADHDLTVDHFVQSKNKLTYQVMQQLAHNQIPIDIISITTALENVEAVGGLTELQRKESLANAKKFDGYVAVLKKEWQQRAKQTILQRAIEEDLAIDTVKQQLDDITIYKNDDRQSITDTLNTIFEAPWQPTKRDRGAVTGIRDFDRITNGLQNGDLIILAARPSMGKTDVMLHMAKNVGWHGYKPLVFSLEMPTWRLRDRLIASTGLINRSAFRDLQKYLPKDAKENWSKTLGLVDDTKITSYDAAAQSVGEIRAKIRKEISDTKRPPVVFIDYLTLIKSETDMQNRHIEVGTITKALKGLAKEFNCPVVVLAQLSRGVEQRQDKRPILSDLRESGSIEEDADLVLFLYREAYYDREASEDEMELIIAKHRNGATGFVSSGYHKESGRLYDLTYQ